MLTTTVTPAIVAVALGVPAPTTGSTQDLQWSMWIGDALMLIEAQATALGVDHATIGQAPLDYVVREAVVAHARHPEDTTQVTISVDDGSTSKTYQSGSGRVSITDEWWAMLGLSDPATNTAFAVDTVGTTAAHLPWCATYFGAPYCSCGADIAGYPIFEGGQYEPWV